MRRFGLIGFPLSHSFSKKYFTEKFARENIDAAFDNYSLENLDTLKETMAANHIKGFAITIPHKKNVIPFLDHADATVLEMNACNCVRISNGKWYGFNTDVLGFEQSFVPLLQAQHSKALVLGTGGAAAAVQFVLKKLGISFTNVSRTKKDNALIYEEVDEAVLYEHTIIINCTPTGTFPKVEEAPSLPYEFITSSHYLYDLIYNPGETLFLKRGRENGATVKNGYEMLVLQAEENWKIWNKE